MLGLSADAPFNDAQVFEAPQHRSNRESEIVPRGSQGYRLMMETVSKAYMKKRIRVGAAWDLVIH